MACNGLLTNQCSTHVCLWQPRGRQQVTNCYMSHLSHLLGISSVQHQVESEEQERMTRSYFRFGGEGYPSMNMEMTESGGIVSGSVSGLRRRRKCIWASSVLAGLVALVIIVATIKTRSVSRNIWLEQQNTFIHTHLQTSHSVSGRSPGAGR